MYACFHNSIITQIISKLLKMIFKISIYLAAMKKINLAQHWSTFGFMISSFILQHITTNVVQISQSWIIHSCSSRCKTTLMLVMVVGLGLGYHFSGPGLGISRSGSSLGCWVFGYPTLWYPKPDPNMESSPEMNRTA